MAAVLNGGLDAELGTTPAGRVLGRAVRDGAAARYAADDPIFLPHLNGERTPYLDTSLRGSWTGLDPRHDRVTLLRSALEGVAFAIRAALDSPARSRSPGRPASVGGRRQHRTGLAADARRHPGLPAARRATFPRRPVAGPPCSVPALPATSTSRPLKVLTPQSEPVAEPQEPAATVFAQWRAGFDRTVEALRHDKAAPAM